MLAEIYFVALFFGLVGTAFFSVSRTMFSQAMLTPTRLKPVKIAELEDRLISNIKEQY